MDNLLKDIDNLLNSIDNKLQEFHDTLEEGQWADFDDKFRRVRRELSTKMLKLDEIVRWD